MNGSSAQRSSPPDGRRHARADNRRGWQAAVARVREDPQLGLVSFFVDAPEPAIVDTGVASSPEAIRATADFVQR